MNVICFNLICNEVNWSLLNSRVTHPSGALLSTNTCSAALPVNDHCAQRLKKEEAVQSSEYKVRSFFHFINNYR
jgi:hypothetical protein